MDAVEPLPEKCLEAKVNNVGTDVAISVMDSGQGIPKQFRDKVGQPFFTAKHAAYGTGLGLSISKGIVTWLAFEFACGVRTHAICGDVAEGSGAAEGGSRRSEVA
ncbi:MAG TPA: HAMP domain-containing sensor histidine kinase [Candidatus Acidoferrum sp.]|nr:HAMP domain-containing sensor histidine kinase [Candidatus Acidoferrum sp.]